MEEDAQTNREWKDKICEHSLFSDRALNKYKYKSNGSIYNTVMCRAVWL